MLLMPPVFIMWQRLGSTAASPLLLDDARLTFD
jgi:hypothetical protein